MAALLMAALVRRRDPVARDLVQPLGQSATSQ